MGIHLLTNRLQHKQKMGESIQAVHYHDDNVITHEKSGLVKLWSIRKSSYDVIETYESGGGYCKSIVLNNSLIVPQENGAVDVLDINNLKKISQLVPEREEPLGRVMCLQEVEIDGTICILGGYETGRYT
ncbi:hypothetical protein NQ314_006612 [Rhamnusium bicolor]|uniref:Uncharacterized protein n=1 Tax=Rhamnusium bicolor TaxID=1586634 RepID=A0AAV8YZ01_9CUCU|nr:hypothetical protein NQ314_006612 [Rhamnusium bicolor]